MQQNGKGEKRTLGQKTEDRLMKYILDKEEKNKLRGVPSGKNAFEN